MLPTPGQALPGQGLAGCRLRTPALCSHHEPRFVPSGRECRMAHLLCTKKATVSAARPDPVASGGPQGTSDCLRTGTSDVGNYRRGQDTQADVLILGLAAEQLEGDRLVDAVAA